MKVYRVVKIRYSLFTVITLVLFQLFGYLPEYIAVSGFMLLHETAHIVAAILLGGSVCELNILPVGYTAVINDSNLSKLSKLVIYFSGAIMNLVMASVFSLGYSWLHGLVHIPRSLLSLFISQNVLLAVFNLLPILPLDGGKIIKEILNDRIGFFSAKRVIRIVTAITAGLIAAAGVYQLLRSKNVSLLVIAVFLFFNLNNTEPEDSFMTMKNIIYRRMRMQKKGIYPARDLAVLKTTPIGEVLKNLDFDRYHLIFVLGDRLEPVKILGEQEVLDGIIKYGINISFGEFIEK